jgi:hypothetical protein
LIAARDDRADRGGILSGMAGAGRSATGDRRHAARQVAREDKLRRIARRLAEQQRDFGRDKSPAGGGTKGACGTAFSGSAQAANQVLFDDQDQLASLSAASQLRAR